MTVGYNNVMLNLFQHLCVSKIRSRNLAMPRLRQAGKFGMTVCFMTLLTSSPLYAKNPSEFVTEVEEIQQTTTSPHVVSTTASHTQVPYTPADQQLPLLPNQIPAAVEIMNQQLIEKLRDLTGKLEHMEHRLALLEQKTGHPIVLEPQKADHGVEPSPLVNKEVPQETTVKTLGTLPASALGPAAIVPVMADTKKLTETQFPEGPKALYDHAFSLMSNNDLNGAKAAFKFFVTKYPHDDLAGTANFYWGDAYYAQQKYEKAAKRFLLGYQHYKNSEKAPDMLLKLAMSLDQIGEKTKACTTLKKLKSEYAKASGQLLQMATNMQVKLKCPG